MNAVISDSDINENLKQYLEKYIQDSYTPKGKTYKKLQTAGIYYNNKPNLYKKLKLNDIEKGLNKAGIYGIMTKKEKLKKIQAFLNSYKQNIQGLHAQNYYNALGLQELLKKPKIRKPRKPTEIELTFKKAGGMKGLKKKYGNQLEGTSPKLGAFVTKKIAAQQKRAKVQRPRKTVSGQETLRERVRKAGGMKGLREIYQPKTTNEPQNNLHRYAIQQLKRLERQKEMRDRFKKAGGLNPYTPLYYDTKSLQMFADQQKRAKNKRDARRAGLIMLNDAIS